eukprot:7098470-Prymnesium_polylepis.1
MQYSGSAPPHRESTLAPIASPPSATHCSAGRLAGGSSSMAQSAGVLQTCVAPVARSVAPSRSFTAARDGRQSAAPAPSAVHASPMHGSNDGADASSTRAPRPTPCATALARA